MRNSAIAFVILASVAAAVASPADAKQRRTHAMPRAQFNQLLPGSAISPDNDPTGVYRNGRLIGRDPDPAIRLQIEQYYGRGSAS